MGADTIKFPPKLEFLFKPSRYKIAHGGRGGAKSWGFARALLTQGASKPLRVLCAREFQNSIADSVHKLLEDQIFAMGLEQFYTVEKAYIRGVNGTEIAFEGIKNNVKKIKSYEGVDICWVEEAANVSKNSWNVLIPTIRKEGAEIWVTFNPELETDETYQRFVKHPPPGAIVEKLNWSDNPWFPETLEKERLHLKEVDFDSYRNVWEGECLVNLTGAVYAKELRNATEEGRITKVPYDRTTSVDVFFDLGRADATSIWFRQRAGFEWHYIDYLEESGESIEYYLMALQHRQYLYGTLWLPHDAKAKTIGTKRSVEDIVRRSSHRVRIVPKLSIVDGINAARMIFPNCYFDAERCSEGIEALRHYRYELLPNSQSFSQNPLHDWASHGADAFRYSGVASKEPKRPKEFALGKRTTVVDRALASVGWLGR